MKRKIGIFSACYHPTLNGVVVSIDTFRAELEKRGFEIFIFAPATKDFKDSGRDIGHVYRYPSFRWPGAKNYPLALSFLAPRLTRRIKSLGLDLIHTQHMFTLGATGLKLGIKEGIPVVHTYHTLIAEYTHYVPLLSSATKRYIIRASRNYCNKCSQIVTPSSPMKQKLRQYGVKTPIEVIPTGVTVDGFDEHFTREELYEKWSVPKDKKILLYLSRIAKEKNIDFLFKVIAMLASRRNDFHVLLVGGGPELGYFRKQAVSLKIDKCVSFTDMQPKKEANKFYGASDIFIFPSVTETQGIVITEAMAAGIPAVAVAKMGPIDIISDNKDGFLVGLDTEAFSQKVEKLLDDDVLRRKFGNQAKIDSQNFSVEKCAQKMIKIYEKTISNYRP